MVAFSLTSVAAAASFAALASAQTFQRLGTCPTLGCILPPDAQDFLAGQYFDIRVEIHAPVNGSEATDGKQTSNPQRFTPHTSYTTLERSLQRIICISGGSSLRNISPAILCSGVASIDNITTCALLTRSIGKPDEDFSLTIAKRGEQGVPAAEFFDVDEPELEGWNFTWFVTRDFLIH